MHIILRNYALIMSFVPFRPCSYKIPFSSFNFSYASSPPNLVDSVPKVIDEADLTCIAEVLNQTIPEYKNTWGDRGFYVSKERKSVGFFIFDLTDTSFNMLEQPFDFKLQIGHVYHIAPRRMNWSISYILVKEKVGFKIFKGVNCSSGDGIQDVFDYIKSSNEQVPMSSDLTERILGYRRFGRYLRVDNYSALDCRLFKP